MRIKRLWRRSALRLFINDFKKPGTCKTQLIANNFIFSLDNDQERVIISKYDNIEIAINDEADEVMKKLFHSPKNRYQNNLDSMKSSEICIDYVQLLKYKCHKTNLSRGGSYIDSSD